MHLAGHAGKLEGPGRSLGELVQLLQEVGSRVVMVSIPAAKNPVLCIYAASNLHISS